MKKTPPNLPPFSLEEMRFLRDADNLNGIVPRGTHEVKMAQDLIERGFLERQTDMDTLLVRCTEKGSTSVQPLTITGTKRYIEWIAEASAEGDDEAACSRERALWRRVLVETALGALEPGIQREVARIALRTATFDFRR